MLDIQALRETVAAVDPSGPPDLRWILRPPGIDGSREIAVLPGSFNPLTEAHLELANAGRRTGIPNVIYLLSKRTVNKERVVGLRLEDRLALTAGCINRPTDGLAFGNLGLYVDQARAFRVALPHLNDLVFLVGYDKIVQIFDRRYYADRDAALTTLFSLARFLVAPRGDDGPAQLQDLLDQPDNRAFADRVIDIPFDDVKARLSSTQVRAGDLSAAPPEIAAFVARWQPFDAESPYARGESD